VSKTMLPFTRDLKLEFKDEIEKLRGSINHIAELTVVTAEDAKHLWDEAAEAIRLWSFIGAKGMIWHSAGNVYHAEKKKGGVLCDDVPTGSTSVSPPASTRNSPK